MKYHILTQKICASGSDAVGSDKIIRDYLKEKARELKAEISDIGIKNIDIEGSFDLNEETLEEQFKSAVIPSVNQPFISQEMIDNFVKIAKDYREKDRD